VLVRDAGVAFPVVVAWPGRVAPLLLDGQAYRGRIEVHRLSGSLTAVNVVELEEYLQGVVKDEIPPAWPAEAVKAMAVAARTYAMHRLSQNPGALFHLRATTASQVYGGAATEDARTSWAVQETRGQILTFGGEPIPAFYHSCSGGATEDALDVFGLAFDTVIGVKDDFSLGCPHVLWVERLTPTQVERSLIQAGHRVAAVKDIQALVRSRTGRILQIAIEYHGGRLVLEGRRFREAVGNDLVRSTDFEVRSDGKSFTFVGRGWGHGVGLSQWGAKEMADLAYQHQDILKFYYPLAQISTLRQD
jgi:stage II sporulation protein D